MSILVGFDSGVFLDGVWGGGGSAPLGAGTGMDLNHWQDDVWADGSWAPESWGGAGDAPVVVIDTHDGADRDRRFRKRNERLRAQLEEAFDSQYGISAQQALAEFIVPQATDALAKPPIDRVDWQLVWKRYDEVVRRLEQAEREQEDEEDAILLLS